jgi:hypothetical protein
VGEGERDGPLWRIGAALASFGAIMIGPLAAAVTAMVTGGHGVNIGVFFALATGPALIAFAVSRSWRRNGRRPVPRTPSDFQEAASTLLPESQADSRYFVGRERLLAELDDNLRSHLERGVGSVVNLYGPQGVGVTTIAAQLVRQIGGQFKDGVLWASVRPGGGPDAVDSASLLIRLLHQMERGSSRDLPEGVEERWSLYTERIGDGCFLVVLDDVDDVAPI